MPVGYFVTTSRLQYAQESPDMGSASLENRPLDEPLTTKSRFSGPPVSAHIQRVVREVSGSQPPMMRPFAADSRPRPDGVRSQPDMMRPGAASSHPPMKRAAVAASHPPMKRSAVAASHPPPNMRPGVGAVHPLGKRSGFPPPPPLPPKKRPHIAQDFPSMSHPNRTMPNDHVSDHDVQDDKEPVSDDEVQNKGVPDDGGRAKQQAGKYRDPLLHRSLVTPPCPILAAQNDTPSALRRYTHVSAV